MRFWDTSAVIPLLVEEPASQRVEDIFRCDSAMVVWWGTSIECVSAIARLEREGNLSPRQSLETIELLNRLREGWREVQPAEKVKNTTERVLRVHPLRAQDAQQLAACILVNEDHRISFVTLDARLELAARKEGLRVVP